MSKFRCANEFAPTFFKVYSNREGAGSKTARLKCPNHMVRIYPQKIRTNSSSNMLINIDAQLWCANEFAPRCLDMCE